MPHNPAAMIAADKRSFVINGERRLLICGEIHYARALPEEWPAILDRTVELGVNTVGTYVFWNFHEEKRDVFDFAGDRDLQHFLSLCHERGLLVILRTGPYCCGEWNYGGFPAWLRDEPGIVFRTWNQPYMARVEKYFTRLFAEFVPHLITNGGPIALVQVENEYMNIAKWYGADGDRYVRWMVELAKRLGANVPLITCEGGVPGAIEGVNGFTIPDDKIQRVRARQPDLPLVWTELWTGWYDTWGYVRHYRDARNIGYHILRFMARGGSGFNHYPWFAGTNFGRNPMCLQCTDYGFDTPLDEYGKPTRKGRYLALLHAALKVCQPALLEGDTGSRKEGATEIHEFKRGRQRVTITLGESAAQIALDGKVLFDSIQDWDACPDTIPSWRSVATLNPAGIFAEPMPVARVDEPVRSNTAVEQLLLTKDRSDYCWYSATVDLQSAGKHAVKIPFGADVLYCFVDGEFCGMTKTPVREWRGPTVRKTERQQSATTMDEQEWANEVEQFAPDGFLHEFAFEATAGQHRLDILATALGLIKGDWNIAGPMHTERKGIWDEVLLDGKPVVGWEMRPFLAAEKQGLPVTWTKPGNTPSRLQWNRFEFEWSRGDGDYRLDLAGWGKGMAFVNGRMLGRYWLLEATGWGVDAVWHPKDAGLYPGPEGEPTQRFYLVPVSWLQEGKNEIVLFEEQMPGKSIELQKR